MRVPLSGPDISEREIELVNEVLTSGYLGLGPKMVEFEQKVCEYTGAKHAITVNSGTSGLHLLVRALDIKDGDEVITTPFSFVASSNCMLFERAKPVFVDIQPDTYNIDPDKIEAAITEKTKAILPVHVFGQCCEMDKIQKIADKYKLPIIEDSCEAIGGEYRGQKAGTFGNAGVFAFYPNKQITTGEGGIIVTNDDNIAKLTKSMRNQGRGEGDHWLSHERLGYNYRLDDMSSALGIAQMERIEEILAVRVSKAEKYNQILSKVSGLILPIIRPEVKMSWFVYVIAVEQGIDRDKVIEYLQNKGIGCRPYFTPIHLQPFYVKEFGYKLGDFPICEDVSSRTIALPFFNKITDEQLEYVKENLELAIEAAQKN